MDITISIPDRPYKMEDFWGALSKAITSIFKECGMSIDPDVSLASEIVSENAALKNEARRSELKIKNLQRDLECERNVTAWTRIAALILLVLNICQFIYRIAGA